MLLLSHVYVLSKNPVCVILRIENVNRISSETCSVATEISGMWSSGTLHLKLPSQLLLIKIGMILASGDCPLLYKENASG